MHGPNDQNDMVAADIQAFGRIRTCANHFFANIAYGVLDQFPGREIVTFAKDRIGFDPKDGQKQSFTGGQFGLGLNIFVALGTRRTVEHPLSEKLRSNELGLVSHGCMKLFHIVQKHIDAVIDPLDIRPGI